MIQHRMHAEELPLRRRVVAFVFFMVADFFYGWSWNTVDVLRPDIRAALRLTLTEAGSMYSAQGAGALIGAIIIGQLADRLGRRNALFGIMVGYGVSLAAGAYVTTYAELVAQRFVLGLFLGGVFPTVVGLYTSLFPREICGKLAGFYNGTFNGSVVVLGLLANRFQVGDWHTLLLIGALPPLVLAPLAYLVVPDDRRVIPYGTRDAPSVAHGRLPVAELFAPDLRRKTLLLALMVGLNFFGSQAFTGWQTTYLTEVRHLDAAAAKEMFGWQFAAAIVGGFVWGAVSDKLGAATQRCRLFWGGARGGRLSNACDVGADAAAARLRLRLHDFRQRDLGAVDRRALSAALALDCGIDFQLGPDHQLFRAADHRARRGEFRPRHRDVAGGRRACARRAHLVATSRDASPTSRDGMRQG